MREPIYKPDPQALISKCLNCEKAECINCIGGGKRGPNGQRKIEQLTKDGRFVRSFPSIRAAAAATGVGVANLNGLLRSNGKRKTAGGFCWRYAEV